MFNKVKRSVWKDWGFFFVKTRKSISRFGGSLSRPFFSSYVTFPNFHVSSDFRFSTKKNQGSTRKALLIWILKRAKPANCRALRSHISNKKVSMPRKVWKAQRFPTGRAKKKTKKAPIARLQCHFKIETSDRLFSNGIPKNISIFHLLSCHKNEPKLSPPNWQKEI